MTRLWVLGALGLLLGLLAPASADRTRLQDAMERKGVLLRRLVGGSTGMTCGEAGQEPEQRRQLFVDGIAVYEPLADDPEKSCVRGVRISILYLGLPRPSNQFPEYNAAWLDLDECPAVLKALRHVHTALTGGAKEPPQFRLVTRSGLVLSTFDTPLPGGKSYRALSLSYPVLATSDSTTLSAQELQQAISALEKAAAAARTLTSEK